MSLSSASTDAEVAAAYDDNSSYAADGSLSKCRLFLAAVTILIRRTLEEISRGGLRVRANVEVLRAEKQDAQKWLENHGGDTAVFGPSVLRADLGGMREP